MKELRNGSCPPSLVPGPWHRFSPRALPAPGAPWLSAVLEFPLNPSAPDAQFVKTLETLRRNDQH